jgi:hypothetical protein
MILSFAYGCILVTRPETKTGIFAFPGQPHTKLPIVAALVDYGFVVDGNFGGTKGVLLERHAA